MITTGGVIQNEKPSQVKPQSRGRRTSDFFGVGGRLSLVSGRKLAFSEAVRDVEGGSEAVSGWF